MNGAGVGRAARARLSRAPTGACPRMRDAESALRCMTGDGSGARLLGFDAMICVCAERERRMPRVPTRPALPLQGY
jgi:hypothetical protein